MSSKLVTIDRILDADTGPKLPQDQNKSYTEIQKRWVESNAHSFGDREQQEGTSPLGTQIHDCYGE
jgi:hypothetical protein